MKGYYKTKYYIEADILLTIFEKIIKKILNISKNNIIIPIDIGI